MATPPAAADATPSDATEEELTGELVAPGAATVERRPAEGAVVVRQAAAVAVGSFAAGLVTVAAVKVLGGRRDERRLRRARRALPIVGSRTFLVDVHLLDPGKR